MASGRAEEKDNAFGNAYWRPAPAVVDALDELDPAHVGDDQFRLLADCSSLACPNCSTAPWGR
jgi:hypothetical protein